MSCYISAPLIAASLLSLHDALPICHFQPGEQTGTPVVTRVLPETISVDPDYLRPYTDEFTGGIDHELIPALRLSAIYTHRLDRKSTRLNSSHSQISYAVFCLKKKTE